MTSPTRFTIIVSSTADSEAYNVPLAPMYFMSTSANNYNYPYAPKPPKPKGPAGINLNAEHGALDASEGNPVKAALAPRRVLDLSE